MEGLRPSGERVTSSLPYRSLQQLDQQLDVDLRLFQELALAVLGAEIESLSVVCGSGGRLLFVDVHSAYGIDRHGSTPFRQTTMGACNSQSTGPAWGACLWVAGFAIPVGQASPSEVSPW